MNRALNRRGSPSLFTLLLSLLLVVAPSVVSAQATFNLAAGLALPNGDFSARNEAGYGLIVGIGVKPPMSPISIRAEGLYTAYNGKRGDDKSHAGGVTGNLLYDFSMAPGVVFTPYVIGGIGYYSTKETRFGEASQNNIGWNAGGGIRFPLTGFSAYVEARYHSVNNVDVKFTPIVFGLAF